MKQRSRLIWKLCAGLLLLLAGAQAFAAAANDRFLDRLSSELRDGTRVVGLHFTRRLAYLSHSPADFGAQVEIRLRRPPAAMLREVAGSQGLAELDATQLDTVVEVRTQGELDSDPAVLIRFDRPRPFAVRAGRDERSIEILLPPTAAAADPAAEAPLPPGETAEQRALADLFRQARQAANAGQYQRSTAIYDKIIASGLEPYVREAVVALGVVRAERGQNAQARAQFERYLRDYPEGPEAKRVRRLLDALLADTGAAPEGTPTAAQEQAQSTWQVFGSFDQFYLLDYADIDGRSGKTYRSSLLSSTNLNWQGRSGGLDVSGRFYGSYDYSFLDERDSPTRVSYAYLDLATTDGRHEGRIGRQRLSGSGVLGYFDGLYYQYQINPRQAVRYVVGSPLRSTDEGVDQDRLFNGLAWDFTSLDQRWSASLYGLYQSFDGETDRRAVGAEGRYLGDTVTAYSLLDYDTYFNELNIFYLFGNWRIRDGTVASLTLDQRRSPGLAVSNAVYGLGADSFDDLDPLLSGDDIAQLAEDRSLVYRSAYASLTQQLTANWQLLLDGGIYSLRDDSAAAAGTGLDSDDRYLAAQLLGTGLFTAGDMYSLGLRYTDAERSDITSVLLQTRIPIDAQWRLSPRLRLDLRDRDDGDTQQRWVPSLFATYRIGRHTLLECDLGAEFVRTERATGDDLDDVFYYLRAGYRHDF